MFYVRPPPRPSEYVAIAATFPAQRQEDPTTSQGAMSGPGDSRGSITLAPKPPRPKRVDPRACFSRAVEMWCVALVRIVVRAPHGLAGRPLDPARAVAWESRGSAGKGRP